MDCQIPAEVFDAVPVPLLVTDRGGRIRHCNPAICRLLGWTRCPEEPCWEAVGLRQSDGRPFCASRCPVRAEQMGRDSTIRTRGLRLEPRRDTPLLDLITRVVPRPSPLADLVVHLLLEPDMQERTRHEALTCPRLSDLTHRERQVLRLLARGVGTASIAAHLGISPVTVRNHVQHILTKLRVHRRVEAVCKLLGAADGSRAL